METTEKSMMERARPVLFALGALAVWRFMRRGASPRPPRKPKRTVMVGPDLTGADLTGAQWEAAVIMRGILKDANLQNANLRKATLTRLDLRGANLLGADLTGAKLRKIAFDKRTILPDGSKWSRRANLQRFTDNKHADYWSAAEDAAEDAAEAVPIAEAVLNGAGG